MREEMEEEEPGEAETDGRRDNSLTNIWSLYLVTFIYLGTVD